jgi:hypothetical protein
LEKEYHPFEDDFIEVCRQFYIQHPSHVPRDEVDVSLAGDQFRICDYQRGKNRQKFDIIPD